jgi:hypothetical protein
LEAKIEQLNLVLNVQKQDTTRAEAKIKRIRGIIDAFATVNPAQIAHLNKLQPQFKFKERTIVFPSQDVVTNDELQNADAGKSNTGDFSADGLGFNDDDDLLDDDLLEDGQVSSSRPQSGSAGVGDPNHNGSIDDLCKPDTVADSNSAKDVEPRGNDAVDSTEITNNLRTIPLETPVQPQMPVEPLAGPVLQQQQQYAVSSRSTAIADMSPARDGPANAAPPMPTSADVRKKLATLLAKEDMLLYDRLMWMNGRLPITNSTMGMLFEYSQAIESGTVKQPLTYLSPETVRESLGDRSCMKTAGGCDNDAHEVERDVKSDERILFTNNRTSMLQTARDTCQSRPSTFNNTNRQWNSKPDYDEFEGIAAKMLLGIMDFIKSGDVTAFAPEDRSAWIAHVLKSAAPTSKSESATVISVGANTARSVAVIDSADAVEGVVDYSEKLLAILAADDLTDTTQNAVNTPGSKRSADAIKRATDEVAKSTWRNMAMSAAAKVPAKTQHAGAVGGAAAVKIKATETQSKLFGRILEMRSTVKEAMKRQIVKYYARGLPDTSEERLKALSGGARGIIGAAYDFDDDMDYDYYAPLNIYAGNLKISVEKGKQSLEAQFNDSIVDEEDD